MASNIMTPGNLITVATAAGALVAAVIESHQCAHCGSQIASGQPWVRVKIYEPSSDGGPHYLRYHSDLFGEEALSCWEKHEMQLETARVTRTAARVM